MLTALLLSIFIQTQECREAYLNLVLQSENYGKYYILTKVSIGHQEREIVVLNLNLYNFLAKSNKNIKNINSYKDFIKDKLISNKPMRINNNELKELQAVVVREDSSVINIAKKGRKYFFDQYFDVSSNMREARMKISISPEKYSQITKILFEWNYPIGTIEGLRAVTDLDFCENFRKLIK